MGSPRFSCVDVVAITIVTGAIAAVVGAAAVENRETANRVNCAKNLRQIGTAIALYCNENRGAYPRTTYKLNTPPTWGTPYAADKKDAGATREANPFVSEKTASPAALAVKPAPCDVTASLFLLLRTEDLTPAAFVCPSVKLAPFDYGGNGHGALEWTNFPGKEGVAAHLSYSYQNPYASADAIAAGFKLNNSITAEFAVAADMNPGVDALLKAVAPIDPSPKADGQLPPERRAVNSLNHGGDGQNVLFGDGHVEFLATPFVGIQRDNIYVAGDSMPDRAKGDPAFVASPVDANDSILLPTAAAVGQVPQASVDPITPVADPAVVIQQIAGTYDAKSSRPGEPDMTLVIDDKTLTLSGGPLTLRFDYRVLGLHEKSAVLELTAPQTAARQVTLSSRADGLDLDEAFGFPAQHWKRRK